MKERRKFFTCVSCKDNHIYWLFGPFNFFSPFTLPLDSITTFLWELIKTLSPSCLGLTLAPSHSPSVHGHLLDLPWPLTYKETEAPVSRRAVRVLWIRMCKVLQTAPPVPGAQPDSHDRSAKPWMWELQSITILVTKLTDTCPPMSVALLATCSFLKSHCLLSWSGVLCNMGLRKNYAYITSKPCKQHARRWETPAKPVQHKDSDIEEASDTCWLLPKKMLRTCF